MKANWNIRTKTFKNNINKTINRKSPLEMQNTNIKPVAMLELASEIKIQSFPQGNCSEDAIIAINVPRSQSHGFIGGYLTSAESCYSVSEKG
jgi:hypothetical protein